jgi:hypothetical protein
MSADDLLWSMHVIGAYEPLEDCFNYAVTDWHKCPKCCQRPRIWVFDNGRYAKCLCGTPYGPAQAKAESICDHLRANNGSALSYDGAALMKAWNKRCKAVTA